MWHSGQVSQQYNNNQRTPLQQSHAYGQKDAAPAASSGSWGRTVVSSGPNATTATQQYTTSSGLLLSAQYLPTVVPAVQISVSGMHQQPAQLTTTLPQHQQSLQAFLPSQQYPTQAQPVQLYPQSGQQPWQPQQAWQTTQLQMHQHLQAGRHIQHHQHHPSQQQQQQHLCQPQRQQPPQQQQHPSQLSLAISGSRGWGGQHLPHPHEATQPVASQETLSRGGRGRGRERAPGSGRGYRGGGGHRSSGSGGSSTGFHTAAGGSQSDTLVHQLVMAVRHMPRGTRTHEVVAGRLAGLDSRGIANLVKQLAATGLLGQAWDFFNWLRELDPNHELARFLDVFVYTAMISLCSASNSSSGHGATSSAAAPSGGGGGGSRRDMDVALSLSREMVDRRVPRNVHTFSALMNVCIKAGQYQAALEVWRELQDAGVRPSVVTYNTLIDAYGKTGQWAEALKVPSRIKQEGMEPVTRTFNTLMIACNLSNQWHEALAVYQQMLDAGHTPNTTTYNALITAYSKAGRLEKVMDVLREMEAAGCERTVITYSSLISACEREGRWELALQLFGRMVHDGCSPNVITFNSLITALAAGGQWERAADVFAEMQRQGCEPDVVTFTALINAYEKGAQWRRALQAFDSMLRQGCRTDHVVFGAIVDALWDSGTGAAQSRAARIYRAAVSGGHVKPLVAQTLASGPSSLNAGAGSLYATSAGLAAASASVAGIGGSGAGAGGCDVLDLHLNALATGSAVVAFLAFLVDQRELVLESGPDAALPSRVVLRFPRSRGVRESCPPALALRDALAAWLRTHGSPFKLLQDSVALTALRFEAAGPDVGAWLLSDAAAIALMPYTGSVSGGGGRRDALADALAGSDEDRSQDEMLETTCRDTFEEVRHFEASRCLSVAAMGPAYLARRRDLAANVLGVAAMLQLPYDVAHDAVQLLDRLMSAAPQLREDLLVMASVTALRMLAVGAASGSAGDGAGGRFLQNVLRQPLQGASGGSCRTGTGGGLRGAGIHAQYEAELDARLAQVTGLPTLGFHSMELNILSALEGDTAAVSGLCCLRLLLRRLGAGAEALAAGEVLEVNPSGPSLRSLMDRALLDSEFLNYRPSATAAAALYCHRLRRGSTPPWPASLASLTGYNDLEHHPELAAAVGAIQRLLMEHSSGAMPPGPAVGATEAATAAAAQVAVFLGTN